MRSTVSPSWRGRRRASRSSCAVHHAWLPGGSLCDVPAIARIVRRRVNPVTNFALSRGAHADEVMIARPPQPRIRRRYRGVPEVWGVALVDVAVVAGVGLVLPACLGGRWAWWWAVAACVAVSSGVGRGSTWAVVLALPWPALAAAVTLQAIRDWRARGLVVVIAGLDAVVAGTWFALSRAGASP